MPTEMRGCFGVANIADFSMVCYNPNVNSVEFFNVDFIYFYVLSAQIKQVFQMVLF